MFLNDLTMFLNQLFEDQIFDILNYCCWYFFISVVAKMNLTFCGGSSKVFKRALNAALDNI